MTTTHNTTRIDIRDDGSMRVRHHHGFGHGLRPGHYSDLGCESCKAEDAERMDDPIEIAVGCVVPDPS
jgi:hypothetical protein